MNNSHEEIVHKKEQQTDIYTSYNYITPQNILECSNFNHVDNVKIEPDQNTATCPTGETYNTDVVIDFSKLPSYTSLRKKLSVRKKPTTRKTMHQNMC